jgi:hypothetical protein
MQISCPQCHRWQEDVILPQAGTVELSLLPIDLTTD